MRLNRRVAADLRRMDVVHERVISRFGSWATTPRGCPQSQAHTHRHVRSASHTYAHRSRLHPVALAVGYR